MSKIRFALLAVFLASLSLLWGGCKATEKSFKITSFPQGARIYVDGDPRGETDMEKLLISFRANPLVTLRLEKEGFQTTGRVLNIESEAEIAFFLQESPNNKEILETLNNIQRLLERFPSEVRNLLRQSSKGEN